MTQAETPLNAEPVQCQDCQVELQNFAQWFSETCPARLHLPAAEAGHYVDWRQIMLLTFQIAEQLDDSPITFRRTI